MAHLTPKENFVRCLKGGIPEWVPSYSYYGPLPGVDEDPPNMGLMLQPLMGSLMEGGSFKDIWGVPYESVPLVGGFSLPKPGEFILKDVRKWREVIKAPDLSNVDWEAVVKDSLSKLPYSRDNVALILMLGGGYFMSFMGMMGFTEGLVALYEEPEAVKELFGYMHDFYMGFYNKVFDLVKPDVVGLGDDTASERAPFISPQMYRDYLIPLYDDYSRPARNNDVPIDMHNCGKSQDFFYDLIRIGVNSWEPVQLSNDIKAMQKEFGRHLVIGGGWEGRGRLVEPDVTDEEIRESVRVCLDSYARDGGFMFAGAYTPGAIDDKKTQHWNEVLQKEVYDYGHTFYK